MEPEPSAQVVAKDQFENLTKITPLSKYLALVLFVIMPFFGVWIGYTYAPNFATDKLRDDNYTIEKTTSTTISVDSKITDSFFTEPQLFISNIKNISFTIPSGWSYIARHDVLLPRGASEPWFLIKNPLTGCLIASGEFEYQISGYGSDEKVASYTQDDFADRVFSTIGQFDGSWYTFTPLITDTSLPPGYINGGGYPIRLSYGLETDEFYLWHEEGKSVPQSCNTSLNEILQSVNYYYESITLSDTTDGVIWVKHNQSGNYLLATLPTGDTYKVLDLPKGVDWAGSFLVKSNKLYSSVNDYVGQKHSSSIIVIDPYTKEIQTLPGIPSDDSYVSSIYMIDETLYYLKGDTKYAYCLDGYGACKADLYSVNINGGGQKMLAEGVLGGKIMGYSLSENSLYFARSTGDAGCSSVIISKYDFDINSEMMIAQESGCVDGSAFNKVDEVYKSVNDKLELTKTSNAIKLNGGNLLPADLERIDSYTEFNFF